METQPSALVIHAWPAHGEYNQDWFQEPIELPAATATPTEIAGENKVKLNPAYFSLQQKWHHGPLLDFRYPRWWRQENITGSEEKPGWLSAQLGGDRTWEYFSLWHIPDGETLHEVATGTSRTQQLFLDFSGEDDAHIGARRALFLTRPHVWLKDPKQLADSQALGPMDVKAARSWDEASLKSWEAADRARYYGMWIWGNMPEYLGTNSLPACYRQVNGSPHYGYFSTHWLLYACTGRADHLRYARANTAHWRDVAIVHYSTPEFEKRTDGGATVLGASHAVGFYPWRSGTQFTFYSGVFPLLMDYYLTGDRRSLETADLHAHALLKHSSLTGYSREFGASFKTALDWYAHSWEPEFGKTIDGGIDWVVKNDPTTMKGKASTPLNWQNFVGEYLDLTQHSDVPLQHRDEVLDYLKKWNAEWIGTPWYVTGYAGNPGNMLAAAWFATGDKQFLQPFQRGMLWKEIPHNMRLTPEPPGLGSGAAGPIYFDQVLYSYAAWRQGIEQGHIIERESELPEPPPPVQYRPPSGADDTNWASRFVILKEPQKRWTMWCRSPGFVPFRLTVTSQEGSVLIDEKLPDETWRDYSLPEDAKAGVYQLKVSFRYGYCFSIGSADKHMLCADKTVKLDYGTMWYFQVPSGVREFKVAGKNITILDPVFQKMATFTGQSEQTITVPAGTGGRMWQVRTPMSSTLESEVRIQGIPPYLAAHPDLWFPTQ